MRYFQSLLLLALSAAISLAAPSSNATARGPLTFKVSYDGKEYKDRVPPDVVFLEGKDVTVEIEYKPDPSDRQYQFVVLDTRLSPKSQNYLWQIPQSLFTEHTKPNDQRTFIAMGDEIKLKLQGQFSGITTQQEGTRKRQGSILFSLALTSDIRKADPEVKIKDESVTVGNVSISELEQEIKSFKQFAEGLNDDTVKALAMDMVGTADKILLDGYEQASQRMVELLKNDQHKIRNLDQNRLTLFQWIKSSLANLLIIVAGVVLLVVIGSVVGHKSGRAKGYEEGYSKKLDEQKPIRPTLIPRR